VSPTAATIRRGLLAGAVAGVASGAPSTLHAWRAGLDPLAASRAAGSLLGRPTLVRGALAHVALSLGWGVVLALLLPTRCRVGTGVLAGGAVAALDLGLVGRRLPAIAALPQGPQVADHLAFGGLVGLTLALADRAAGDRGRPGGPGEHR
jgi:hypothetical protein